MRGSSAASTTFEQWLADRTTGVIARPMGGGDRRHHRRTPSAAHLDMERLAELANDVLGIAIKLVVMLEAARQMTGARQNSTFGVPAKEDPPMDDPTIPTDTTYQPPLLSSADNYDLLMKLAGTTAKRRPVDDARHLLDERKRQGVD